MKQTAKRKRTWSLWMIFTVFALVLAACGGGGESKQNEEKGGEKGGGETIRIGYVTILSNAPAVVAQQKKLMEEQGLTGEFYSFSNGPDLYKALSSGKLDVAYAGVPAAVNWASRGANMKAIAKVSDGKFGLMVGENSDIKSPADLKGKKIGSLVQGSGADILLRGMILPEGKLKETDVSIAQMQMSVMEQAISKGSVDAAMAGEPFLSIAELRGAKVIKEVPDPALVVLAREDLLKDDPEKVATFMEGHKASIDYINQHKEEAAEVLVKAFNVPKTTDQNGKEWAPTDVLLKALERHSFDYKITEEDFEFYQEVSDLNYQLKMIDKPFDVNTLFDKNWIQ